MPWNLTARVWKKLLPKLKLTWDKWVVKLKPFFKTLHDKEYISTCYAEEMTENLTITIEKCILKNICIWRDEQSLQRRCKRKRYWRRILGSLLIKKLCCFARFCDIRGICQLYKNCNWLWFFFSFTFLSDFVFLIFMIFLKKFLQIVITSSLMKPRSASLPINTESCYLIFDVQGLTQVFKASLFSSPRRTMTTACPDNP